VTLPDPYEQLGVTPEASSAEIKAAYHQRLRQFPAHSHPREFQQIRAAYDAIRSASEHRGDPLLPGPLRTRLDPVALAAIETSVRSACRLSLTELLRLTF
jgi:hypothetical protein